MKNLNMSKTVLNGLLLTSVLAACQNEQKIYPVKESEVSLRDQGAKGNLLLRLVKRGFANIQYLKSGKFFGKISKVTDNIYWTEYIYDDSDPSGIVKITSKRYKKTNSALVEEIYYKLLSNGLCFKSVNSTTFTTTYYFYNAQGLLNNADIYSANGDYKRSFTYDYSAATNAYRLAKVETVNSGGIGDSFTITYSSSPDNYSQNPTYTGLDRHLPIFGRFSDVLPKHYSEKTVGNPTLQHEFTYGFDNSGYVTWEQVKHTYGQGMPATFESVILNYSDNWQGI